MSEPEVPRNDVLYAILNGPVMDHHRDCEAGRPFAGGPLPAEEILQLADLVAKMYRLDKLAMRIARGLAAPYELHTLVATVWAGGFKAGAEYAQDLADE